MAYRNYSTAVSHIVDATGQGDFTTISAALTAASSGQTIFIRPGTYTENPTLKAGVDLAAYDCDALTPNVTINGKCTFTAAGTVTISGIQLETNSDFFLAVTGSAASIIYLKNCYLNCLNNTGIIFSTSSSSANISIRECEGNLATTGISLFSHSSAGLLSIQYTVIGNSGGSSTASTISGTGTLDCKFCAFTFPITASSSSTTFMQSCNISSAIQNVTCLTLSGTATATVQLSLFQSGTAATISAGSGTTAIIATCTINSTNTNPITGAGTTQVSAIDFISTGVGINATTITPRSFRPGLLLDKTGSSGTTGQIAIATTSNEFTWSAFPQISGLGVGASPGSTAGITFDGSNFLNSYTVGTFTPTMVGSTSSGTTTYTVQNGYYVQIGSIVHIQFDVEGSGATGTGNVNLGGFPFTIKNQSNGRPIGTLTMPSSLTWPASTTSITVQGTINTILGTVSCSGSGAAGAQLSIANAAFSFRSCITYEI